MDKRDLIKKHIGGWNGLSKTSIDHFAETGKASGTFLIALEKMLEEYANKQRENIKAGTLTEIQNQLPWTIKYSRDFKANPQPHKDFAHALTHVIKASGNIAALIDDLDHRRESKGQYKKYVADLVVCALRMANTAQEPFDLHKEVIDRLESKNGVILDLKANPCNCEKCTGLKSADDYYLEQPEEKDNIPMVDQLKQFLKESPEEAKKLWNEVVAEWPNKEKPQEEKLKECPKCQSKKVGMFTPDMDWCAECKHQWYV